MKLNGKTALVTGAARRIGRHVALTLARHGARVVIHYNRSKREALSARDEARRYGVDAECLQADLRDPKQIRRLTAHVKKTFGHVDILINNASVYEPDSSDSDRTIETNIRAPYLLMQSIAPAMKRRGEGKIINLVDWAGVRPDPRFILYSASRAALVSMTQSFALAFAPEVQVNAIAPGAILPPERGGIKAMKGSIARTPLQRKGSPEDIAQAVLYLLEHGDYITGQTLFVDGGRFLNG